MMKLYTIIPVSLASSIFYFCLFAVQNEEFKVANAFTINQSSNIHQRTIWKERTHTNHQQLSTYLWSAVNDDSSTETHESDLEEKNNIQTFEMLGLTSTFQQCTNAMGWKNPTPIQKLTIPAILKLDEENYNSVWSEAPTGSGKTGGYALPLLQLISQQKRKAQISSDDISQNKNGKVTALILVPTRELAMQINWVFSDLADALPKKFQSNKLNHLVIHGGVPLEPQIQALASRRKSGSNVDVLIATPGRLMDVLLHYTKKTDDQDKSNKKKKFQKVKDSDIDYEKAADAALEQKLLAALDDTGKRDTSLTLQNLMDIKLDKIDSSDVDGRNLISDMLDSLSYLVVDEADRLLGQPFQKELDPLLQLLPSWSKSTEENEEFDSSVMKSMLFSATFPEQIQPR